MRMGTEMIDIHCHLLFGVDDGADSMELSLAMIDDAVEQGITDIILTPHYRRGMFPYDTETVKANFAELSEKAAGRDIKLYLGCEYHANSDMIEYLQNGRCLTLAETDHVLVEFSYDSAYIQVQNRLDELISSGYIPVIAHAERYGIFEKDPDLLLQFREMGVLVQINANSILGIDGSAIKKVCKKILKKDLADIVASDSHDLADRRSHMKECAHYVAKKYGENTMRRLFTANPSKIITNNTEI